jgi:hypothetical protein
LSSLIVVRKRGVSKSSISHCEKSARELKAKEWRISREESKKYSKREGLSLGTRTTITTRTIDLPQTPAFIRWMMRKKSMKSSSVTIVIRVFKKGRILRRKVFGRLSPRFWRGF